MADASVGGRRCWCGASDLEPLRSDYGRCASCGTVVFSEPYDPAEYASTGPEGFYGDGYWRRYVPERLGLPGLEERARSDLAERAVFHLERVTERLAPPARVLELGCGAGSLTYLLGVAGFDACGVELGPAAIELARRRFGIEVHRGPLAGAEVRGLFDAVVAVDVLEHLPDPLETMTLCGERLAPGGLLFLQTPCYRDEGPGWEMLLPREHLYLFTETAVERLLHAAGFQAVEVSRSLFPYDMWVVASPAALPERRPDPLAGVAPVAVALIDARAEAVRAAGERDAVDADRRLKETDNERLLQELAAVRGDQRDKEHLLRRQHDELDRLRGDQSAKAELIRKLDAELETVRGDQSAKAELIGQLSVELATVRGDQSAKAELIGQLSVELATVRGDQSAKAELIEQLSGELATARGDQSAKEELILRLDAELESLRGDQSAKAELIARLDAELATIRGDQSAKEALISRLDAELAAVRGDQSAKEALISRLDAELESVRGDQSAKEELIGHLDAELRASASEGERARAELERLRAELEEIRGDRLWAFLAAARSRFSGGRR